MGLLQEIQVPLLAVNDTSLTVAELNFAPGAKVNKGDLIMVLETSKTTYDVEAETEGYIQYLCEPGSDYEVNEIIAHIYSTAAEAGTAPARETRTGSAMGAGSASTTDGLSATGPVSGQTRTVLPAYQLTQTAASTEPLPFWEGETLFSREAVRLMDNAGINRSVFRGKDFVNGADVRNLLQPEARISAVHQELIPVSSPAGAAVPRISRAASASLPIDLTRVIVQKLASSKKREIEYLGDIQSTGLTSTVHTFVDTEGLFTFINRGLRYMKDSLLPVILYEVSRLLADYPLLNGYFTGDAVAVYKEVNPGFAIDIDKGLKVLKVAAAGQKSIGDIETDILQLSGQYLDDTLSIDQLTDITFTLTDLSSEGVAFFRPLINKMNSSILGVSAIDEKLNRCTLSLTFDHRVTEGRLAAKFLRELKERLESYRPKNLPANQDIACFKCYKTLKEDLGGTGFARCVTPDGKDGYICQSCLKGF